MKNSYGWVKGVNYVPSYARNDFEMWTKYDHDIVDRELGYAERLGFNCVRVFMNYHAYAQMPNLVTNRFADFLSICERRELKVIYVPFCSVWSEVDGLANDKLKQWISQISEGKQPLQSILEGGLSWIASPGYFWMGKEHWSKLEQYLKDVVGPHVKRPSFMICDIISEPYPEMTIIKGGNEKIAQDFIEHFYVFLKELSEEMLLTIKIVGLKDLSKVEKYVDVISFEALESDPTKFREILVNVKKFGNDTGKPVLLSEFGNLSFSIFSQPKAMTEEGQLEFYESILPIVLDSDIGWLIWELMVGRDWVPFTGLFYPDGRKRPAADFIERMIR